MITDHGDRGDRGDLDDRSDFAQRGDQGDRGDLDDRGDCGDYGPDSDGYCSFTLLGFESWLIYNLHTLYEQTPDNQRNAFRMFRMFYH